MKQRVAVFFLGMMVAWTGMPALQHAIYWMMIMTALGVGFGVGHHLNH